MAPARAAKGVAWLSVPLGRCPLEQVRRTRSRMTGPALGRHDLSWQKLSRSWGREARRPLGPAAPGELGAWCPLVASVTSATWEPNDLTHSSSLIVSGADESRRMGCRLAE